MHMAGKEKMLATRPTQEVLAVTSAVSDLDESEAVGNGSSSPIIWDLVGRNFEL
jgi:hypothetical protein